MGYCTFLFDNISIQICTLFYYNFEQNSIHIFKINNVYLFIDRQGLKGIGEISRLSQAVVRALRLELDRNHSMPIKGDVTVCDALLTKMPTLR